MLREAARTLSRNLGDPFLAVLVTRIVELRLAINGGGGYLLGPETRRVIREDLLPLLMRLIEDPNEGVKVGVHGLDAVMFAFLCGHWLQDLQVIKKALDLGVSVGIFDLKSGNGVTDITGRVHHHLSVAGVLNLLLTSPHCSANHRCEIALSLQNLMSNSGLQEQLHYTAETILSQVPSFSYKESDFMKECTQAFKNFKSRSINTNGSVEKSKEGGNESALPTVSSKGFNFGNAILLSGQSNISAETTDASVKPSAQDIFSEFEAPARIRAVSSKSHDIFSSYDAPLSSNKPATKSSGDIFSSYDASPVSNKPSTITSGDVFSAYDVPPASNKPATKSSGDIFSSYDAPPVSNKPATQSSGDIFSSYDAPPVAYKPATQSSVDIFSSYDAPPVSNKPATQSSGDIFSSHNAPPVSNKLSTSSALDAPP